MPDLEASECPQCGAERFWVDCWNGCEDGRHSLHDEDPLFYDEGDWETCDVCQGAAGWLQCDACCAAPREEVTSA